MLYKLRIRVVMQNRYLVIVLGVRLLSSGVAVGSRSHRARHFALLPQFSAAVIYPGSTFR